MVTDTHRNLDFLLSGRTLSAYLLGTLEFETFFSLQRRLLYDIEGDRTMGAVVMCDHPAAVTIGREGSRAHIRPNIDELTARFRLYNKNRHPLEERSPVQWASRGGGAMLHLPGQVACYPLLPLDPLGLSPACYLQELQTLSIDLLQSFNINGTIDPIRPGVQVNGRRAIHIGVAVRKQITCFGLVINVNPKLELFHAVQCDGDPLPMTSLQREASCCIRVLSIRQRLLELLAARFGFEKVITLRSHPGSQIRSKRNAAAQSS